MQKYAIQKKKLYEEVLEQISKLISSGEYGVGDRLPSLQELCNMFEVGKPTLREALSVLASTGILEIRHGSGIFVLRTRKEEVPTVDLGQFERDNLLYWLEFRRAIEVETARLAAVRRNAEDLVQIEEALLRVEEEIKEGRTGADWDYIFHQRIALATHNPIFSQAITTTEDILKEYFELSIKQSKAIPSRPRVVIAEHREIVGNIKRKDAVGASEAMLRHIENVESKVKFLSNGPNRDNPLTQN
jgi:GntR family transcriptional regulator, transcriptional repressor for pyruvate dehydrogenase complex